MINKVITRALIVALLFLVGGTGLFATGSEEVEGEKPTLVWVTSVQGGREPEEIPLFDA